ncbi:hypothetical protein PQX77_009275 [Marasmius sp. AFHP31]|nr:hypothetical protein PQX77_009275 [Marasmius sp. AFHP31]
MFNHSNSSRTSVSGGTFSVVHGNQLNYYTGAPRDRRRFHPGEEWKEEIYREYERMPRGQIKLINTISETEVKGESYKGSGRLTEERETSQAKRVLHLACTVSGTRESPPFLVIKYTGRDAYRAFKMDVLQFSRLDDPVLPQLRGFNDSQIPMVIFHDLLVPAVHAIQHAQDSPTMLCYLRLQGETAISKLPPATVSIILSQSGLDLLRSEHIWIRPQTGDVCLGPAGPLLIRSFFMPAWPSQRYPYSGCSPLPLSAYNSSALFDYLIQNATNEFILTALFLQCTQPRPDENWLLSAHSSFLLPNYSCTFSLDPIGHAQSRRDYDSYQFEPYYLFILPPPQLPDTTPDVVSWMQAPAESLYYWSVDPDGNSRMPEAHRMELDLPCFRNCVDPPHSWKAEIYDLVRQWQEAKGFDPTTTDFARSLGYPIVEILPQDNDRFDAYVENDESTGPKREQEPGPMQVDEAFATIPGSQDPSFPPRVLEGSASMDVDMEDCSSRMASLRVETMWMDE